MTTPQMPDQQLSSGGSPTPPSASRRTSETRLGRPSGVLDGDDAPCDQNRSGPYKPVATTDERAVPSGAAVSDRWNNNTAPATIFADLAVVVLPLGVIVFIILVWRLDGTRVDGNFSAWQNAINVFATAFPILFASIVGRLMSSSARWALEKGGSLSLLEQLMGSRTVGSTVASLFTLRNLNFLAAALLLVWAFSPLGAQAILRMLDLALTPDVGPADVVFFDTGAPPAGNITNQQGSNMADGLSRPVLTSLATLYTILVGTPKANKVDAMDLWGNVRIPLLSDDAGSDWKDVSDYAELEYSSLAGVPVTYSGTGNTTFTLKSSHIRLTCPNSTQFPASNLARPSSTRPVSANVTTDFLLTEYPNGTWRGYPYERTDTSSQWTLAVDRFVDLAWLNHNASDPEWSDVPFYPETGTPSILANETGIEAGPSRLLLRMALAQGQVTKKNRDNLEISCAMTQEYVESRVRCTHPASDQRSCRVVAQRPSQQPHATSHVTQLSFPRSFDFVSRELPVATGRKMVGFVDPTLYYLKDPTFERISEGTAVLMDEIDPSKVGVRFGQLLNTYLALSQVSATIANTGAGAAFEPNVTATGEASTLVETFVVSRLWIGLCLLSTCVLFIGGVLSVVFTHLTYGPEVLGYVSTAIRNSKFVALPSSTTWLDGAELTNKMGAMRIRYGFMREALGEPEAVLGVGHYAETVRIKDGARFGQQ